MKNMGLSKLVLVKPCEYKTYDCYARASGAEDIVDAAQVFDDLASAVADSTLVIGTSARLRSLAWPQLNPRECADTVAAHVENAGTASVVFGRERSGLCNAELSLCSSLLHIPTVAEFSSLNVAAAVQVVAYELMVSSAAAPVQSDQVNTVPVPQSEMERFYEHFFDVLTAVGYHDPENPRQLPLRMRRLFNRAQPDHSEMQVLRGFLAAVEKKIR
jgi:TrmH family RNA methyltransferase